MRVGLGFDAHAFDRSRPLVLGGFTIPGAPGLAGHSDADVLSHAVADALLGAAGLGDLGELFPATPEHKNAASVDLLGETVRRVRASGWEVGNVDATVIAERPRLSGHRSSMAEGIARALGVGGSAVSVKATTTDGLGFTGRAEGIAAIAVVLLKERSETGR
ncbi:2-C-methyl-D-erythritol 2,4-cyclodiphosphate synthase [soil metagenome]